VGAFLYRQRKQPRNIAKKITKNMMPTAIPMMVPTGNDVLLEGDGIVDAIAKVKLGEVAAGDESITCVCVVGGSCILIALIPAMSEGQRRAYIDISRDDYP
jgi:hypothetical protein